MGHGGRHEQNVARAERVAVSTIPELPSALDHDVDLIAGMRGLGIGAPRGVELDRESAVLEELDEALALR
jgi:hypothetical protein